MSETHDSGAAFVAHARQYLAHEYPTKLRRAVEALPTDALWWRPNGSSNSVGNLLVHLAGNVRQWIIAGVGGAPDNRNRAAEFNARDGRSAAELLGELERTLAEADEVLAVLTPSALLERRVIQGRDITVLDAIFSVVQHFSQHLGQVIWIAKFHAPDAVRFYEDAGGLAFPIWDKRAGRDS